VYVSPAWYWIVKYHAGRTTEPHFSSEKGGKAPCFSLRLGALAVGETRIGGVGEACATLATGELEASARIEPRTVRAVV
jgi:hypothetical protein